MNFDLTNEQKDIQKAAREFAEKEFSSIAQECDEKEIFPREVWKKACALGLLGVQIKEEYGGGGLGLLEHAIITEEFWRVDPGCGQSLVSTIMGSDVIQLIGTEEQKQRYLPPVMRGEKIMGVAVTEPDAGSDVAAARTEAVKASNEYVINGSKVMIGNGSIADFLLVFCLTNPKEESKYNRHSMFIVETGQKGYEADKMTGKMGLRASDTANIFFHDVRVPRENLLGIEGKGFLHVMQFFDLSRSWVGAHGVGLAQGVFEKTVKHVKERRQFGRPIGSFQGVQFEIAEMALMIETGRNLVHKACWTADHKGPDSKLTSLAKWYGGWVGVRVVDKALQLHGGYGYFAEQEIERFYRAAKAVEIYEGSKEVEKMIVARQVLGRI